MTAELVKLVFNDQSKVREWHPHMRHIRTRAARCCPKAKLQTGFATSM